MGKTTRKLIKTERFFEPAQISARITKDATGTDLTKAMAGARNSLRTGRENASLPIRSPAKNAARNPAEIFWKDIKMESQKAFWG